MQSPQNLKLLSLCLPDFVILLLSLISFSVSAQHVADSLEKKLITAHGEERVNILNHLTYEFISVDNKKVVRYSDEAIELSKNIKYLQGEGIAHTYRGVYYSMSGQFAEAHKSLHKGLRISLAVNDRDNIAYTYLQLGICGLEEVNMDSAILYLTKARLIAKDSTNPETLSKIYRNLSALYGQRFQLDSQQFYLDRSIEIRRKLPDQSLLTDALALQATNKLKTGNITEAEKLITEAEEIVKKNPGDVENMHDVKHLRALILFQKGEFEEASVLFDSARNYYFKTALMRKYVTLLTDLGKVFADRGEYELALNNLYDALELSKLQGFETEIYIIRSRIGWVNFNLGDYNQALRLANESLESASNKILKADLANALTLKGVVLTEQNKFNEARMCLDSVLGIYKNAGYDQKVSESLMNLGTLEVKLHHYPIAITYFKQSLEIAERVGYSYGLAWSSWGVGDIYVKQGNYVQATNYLNASEKYSHLIQANELLILNFNSRRDLLAAQGRFKEALQFSIKASQLNDSIHRGDLARRFVNLEKIQEIEERDRNIKELQKDKQLAVDKINLQDAKLRQQFILLVTGLIGIALLIVLVVIYNRFYSRIKSLNISISEKNIRIEAQAAKLQEINTELNQLYQEVSEQNEEILSQANELAESHKSVSDINRELERMVTEKTVELRNTNDELVKHNNELLQFSYTVSHNLRGPVARLLGLSTLMESEKEIEQARQWIKLIHKTTYDLDLIIRDLSKILELRNEPHQYRELVDLEQEWKQSLSLLQDSLTGDETITTDFSAISQLTTVRPMLQNVVYNLLSNALKFRSPDRSLKINASSRIEKGNIIIEVSDNGLGFDTEAHKEKLFKLYRRFHSHVEGRGLGLYLIKSQLEVLHGSIDVKSVLDKGSTFTIALPLTLSPELSNSIHQ